LHYKVDDAQGNIKCLGLDDEQETGASDIRMSGIFVRSGTMLAGTNVRGSLVGRKEQSQSSVGVPTLLSKE
jgi:hypothetical protein